MGAARLGGIDINRHRARTALAGVLALAVSPAGITVANLAAGVPSLSGQTEQDYTARLAAYDLRKLRGDQLVGRIPANVATPEVRSCRWALVSMADQG